MIATVQDPEPTYLGVLADRLAPDLAPQVDALNLFMPTGRGTDPGAMIDLVDAVHGAFSEASTPQETLRASAELKGIALRQHAAPAPAPLVPGILALYDALDAVPTAAQLSELSLEVATLAPAQRDGIGLLVGAVNRALALQAEGTMASRMEASILLYDAADAARPYFAARAAGLTACDVFEDPQQLIWIGSTCNDTLAAFPARVLQYDPAGDDTYLGNSGGAMGNGFIAGTGGLVQVGFTSERSILEVRDNVTTAPWSPGTDDPDFLGLELLLFDLLDNGTNAIVVANNTDAHERELQFLQEFVDGIEPNFVLQPDAVRRTVPVALAIDESGNDNYTYTGNDPTQGSGANGGVGVLLDRAGDDDYTCSARCQGFSSLGVGGLADLGGSDVYTMAGSGGQGAGDAAFLLDYSGSDSYTSGGVGTQGSTASLLAPHLVMSLLFDGAGDDTYTAQQPLAQGGGGILVDLSGSDSYSSQQRWTQGAGVITSLGLLLDGAGDDTYSAVAESQGAAITAPGILADLEGNDAYTAVTIAQGASVSGATSGMLLDGAGDDTYTAGTRAQGWASSGQGVLADLDGNDAYTAGDFAQGSSDRSATGSGTIALVLDANGDDTYTAGDRSQGSGATAGTGALLDLSGADAYVAGALSQGSGGDDCGAERVPLEFIFADPPCPVVQRSLQSGAGILMDDLPQKVEANGVSVSTELEVNGGAPAVDTYTATDFSQGSSGPTGGIGLLLENGDRAAGNGNKAISTFVAGDFSQGSATGEGFGALVNGVGRDSYTAGDYSQGASIGGLGALVDNLGRDSYTANAALSHGYGQSDITWPHLALGLLVDDGGNDSHPDMGDNECKAKGDIGLAIDASGLSVPSGCSGVVAGAATGAVSTWVGVLEAIVVGEVTSLVETVEALVFGSPVVPPTGAVYFYDNVENTADSQSKWTVTGGTGLPLEDISGEVACLVDSPEPLTTWRIRSQQTDPQVAPNAHTGAQYWYAGLPAGPLPVYGYASCTTTTLTSQSIDLTTAGTPELRAWIGGSSEATFDFLYVRVVNETSSVATTVATYDTGFTNGNILPAYSELVVDLTSYAGHNVHLEFQFVSDISLADGQGYNVDDILVQE